MAPEFSVKTLKQKKTLGDIFSEKRNSLKLSIEQVEEATKIRAIYIIAIEKGEREKLPPDAYVFGFIKNYADFLGLSSKKMMALFRKELDSKKGFKKTINGKSGSIAPRVIITPKTLVIYGITLISLVIIFYIGWQVKILAAPPRLEITSPQDKSTATEDSMEISGKTDAGADIYINDYLIGSTSDGNFNEKITLQEGLNVIKVKSRNKIGKETTREVSIAASLKNITLVKEEIKGVELKVDVGPNSAWIYIEADNVPIDKEGILMLSGASRTFSAKDKITLTTKNAGSTNVIYNGKDIGALGKEGETIKNREFTKDMQIK